MNLNRNFIFSTVAFVVLAILFSASGSQAGRGVRVKLKKSEKPDAPAIGEVKLYSSSYALVIGIDNYTDGWPRLSGAVKDARLVARELENQGFETTLKTDLKSRDLEDALSNFFIFKGEDPEARLFVWFAGHGHTMDDEGYLVPADAPLPRKTARFKYKALSLRRFGELVRQARSKHAMAVFDSCFSGTIFSTQRSAPPAAITRAATLPVRQFLSSGDADQEVSDDGRFRKLFIRALRGEEKADANGDGYITGSELGLFLTDRVTNLTQSRQTPRYGKLRDENYDRGDFVFLVAGGGDGSDFAVEGPARETPRPRIEKIPETGTIRANLYPPHANISFLTLEKTFRQGMSLFPGDYQVEVSADGYESARVWFSVEAGREKEIAVDLEPVAKAPPPAPPKPEVVDITLQYQGDQYGCILDLALNIDGRTVVPTTNVLSMRNVRRGAVGYSIGGTINCGYMGSCSVYGQGTINAVNGGVYSLVWQNTDMGQCTAWFTQ